MLPPRALRSPRISGLDAATCPFEGPYGRIYRVVGSGERWRAEPVVELPGAPLWFTVRDDHIVIATVDDVVAVSPAGTLQMLECR